MIIHLRGRFLYGATKRTAAAPIAEIRSQAKTTTSRYENLKIVRESKVLKN
jgi:hypothetical protein